MLQHLLAPLVPTACFSCRRSGSNLCLVCLRSLVIPYGGRCYRCLWGRPSGATCIGCYRDAPLAGVSVGVSYESAARNLIFELKHRPDQRIALVLATILTRRILSTHVVFDQIVAVPTAPSRYRERGYNQTELIAREMMRLIDVPLVRPLLRLSARHQIGSDRRNRFEQIGGVFALRPGVDLQARRILIIDDVMTTGATLDEAARVLRAAGARSVWGGVIARR